MSQSLPQQASLRQLQIQAKELAKQVKGAEPEALDRLRRHAPRFADLQDSAIAATAQLSDAQLVIAREYGFESWPKLHAHLDKVTLHRLAEAVKHGTLPEVRALLRQNPKLVDLDMAENDEHRVLHFAVLRRDEAVVRLLVEAGADPHKGVYPHRDATTALMMARDREFAEIVRAIEEEEQLRREELSCPNATVSPAQDELAAQIRRGEHVAAIARLNRDHNLIKACDREGATVLHLACQEAALPVIDWLLEHHADTRKKNLKGWTPLEGAVVRINWKERRRCDAFPEFAVKLLGAGARMTPLVAAALGDLNALRRFHDDAPEELLALHALGFGGPLSTAVLFGKPEAVKLLLDLGLDPNERHTLPNLEEEITSAGKPLWLAAAFGEYEIARMLLDAGAEPLAQVYASGSPFTRAYCAQDRPMMDLLAAFGGHPEPLEIGAQRDVAAAVRLLKTDSSPKTVEDMLWGAAAGGSPEIVSLCLPKLGWALDEPRWFRILCHPLSLMNHAPHSQHPELFDRSTYPECLRLIVRHGVSVNVQTAKGETMMHSIVAAGRIWGREVMTDAERLDFARILLEASPDLTLRDQLLKSTPLGWACRWGRGDLVRLLLAHGARPDEPEAEPWATPMAWATKKGHPAIVELLREAMSEGSSGNGHA